MMPFFTLFIQNAAQTVLWITAGVLILSTLMCLVSVCFARYRPKSKKQSSTVNGNIEQSVIRAEKKIRPEIGQPYGLTQMPKDMPIPRFGVSATSCSKLPSPPPRIQEAEIDETVYINHSYVGSPEKEPKFLTFIPESNEESTYLACEIQNPAKIKVMAHVEQPIYDSVPSYEDCEGIYDMVPSIQDSESSFPSPPPDTYV